MPGLREREGIEILRNRVLSELQRGYHEGGHHPRCATREDAGCNCYAASTYSARSALAQLVAMLHDRNTKLDKVADTQHSGPS